MLEKTHGNSPAMNATPSTIMADLRSATTPEHKAMEEVMDVMEPDLKMERYREILEIFYGYYRPLEHLLSRQSGWGQWGVDLAERSKIAWLEYDLKKLGVSAPESLPLCRDLPEIANLSQAFGCMYVMEGSTLGGQYIQRHLQERLGLNQEKGARFFQSYQERVGPMWKSFGAALTSYATAVRQEQVIINAAAETFRKFHGWFLSKS